MKRRATLGRVADGFTTATSTKTARFVDALNMLYDCLLENPVHYLADWILAYHDEKQIAKWILNLKEDENETNG